MRHGRPNCLSHPRRASPSHLWRFWQNPLHSCSKLLINGFVPNKSICDAPRNQISSKSRGIYDICDSPRSGVPITDKWIQPRLVFDQNCTENEIALLAKSCICRKLSFALIFLVLLLLLLGRPAYSNKSSTSLSQFGPTCWASLDSTNRINSL